MLLHEEERKLSFVWKEEKKGIIWTQREDLKKKKELLELIMENKNNQAGQIIIGLFMLSALLIGSAFLLPWERINWGKISMGQDSVIVVSGEAKSTEKNQIASFSAGVSSVKDEKNDAISEVNGKIEKIISEAKKFGIADEDIQTQSMSIYQMEENYWDGQIQKSRKGQWRVNNTVEITLREVDRASELASLLTESGATNVYGPNFRMDDTSAMEDALFGEAIKNAKEKAELMAKDSGRSLGKVVSVTEGGVSNQIYPLSAKMVEGGGGGMPVEGGSTTVSKSVTVVFELK